MTTPTSLYVCLAALDARWGLGDLPVNGGQMLMIGWGGAARAQQGAVPDAVAMMLAHALCAVAQVSFPVSRATLSDLGTGGAILRVIKPGTLMERAEAVIAHEEVNLNLLSTHLPATMVRVFEDYSHPWHTQGQAALLSAVGQVPGVDRKTLLSVLNGSWVNCVAGLRQHQVQGVVRPGVDGQVAGVLSLSEEFTSAFLPALEREALRAEMDWHLLVERDFAQRVGKMSRRFAQA